MGKIDRCAKCVWGEIVLDGIFNYYRKMIFSEREDSIIFRPDSEKLEMKEIEDAFYYFPLRINEKEKTEFISEYCGIVESEIAVSERKKHAPFTKKPVNTLVSCQRLKPQSCLWSRLYSTQSHFRRACCTQTGDVVPVLATAGISRCHENVRCWSGTWSAAHGRDRRCTPFLLQESTCGFRWY